MEKILIGKTEIELTPLIWQDTPNGGKFRLSGSRRNAQVPEKWINGVFKFHMIYDFIYTDGKMVSFEFDYNGKFLKKL